MIWNVKLLVCETTVDKIAFRNGGEVLLLYDVGNS